MMKAVESIRGAGEKPNREVNVKGKNKKGEEETGGRGTGTGCERMHVRMRAGRCVLGVGRTEFLRGRD